MNCKQKELLIQIQEVAKPFGFLYTESGVTGSGHLFHRFKNTTRETRVIVSKTASDWRTNKNVIRDTRKQFAKLSK